METIIIEFWYWWVFAVILMILELFAPGAFFLWMGVAAILVGMIVGLLPNLGWEYQILAFSVFSVVSVVIWRIYLKKNPPQSDLPLLNQRSAQIIGREFTLQSPIVDGQGKIKVDDTTWKIQGDDYPENTRVKVVDVDGVILKVKSID